MYNHTHTDMSSSYKQTVFTAQAYARAVLGVVILAVCPSVRLSVCLSHAWLLVPPFIRAFLKSPSSRGLSAIAELLVRLDFCVCACFCVFTGDSLSPMLFAISSGVQLGRSQNSHISVERQNCDCMLEIVGLASIILPRDAAMLARSWES